MGQQELFPTATQGLRLPNGHVAYLTLKAGNTGGADGALIESLYLEVTHITSALMSWAKTSGGRAVRVGRQGSAIDAMLPHAWREKQKHLANSTNNYHTRNVYMGRGCVSVHLKYV